MKLRKQKSVPPGRKLIWASIFAFSLALAVVYLPTNSFFDFTSLPLHLLGIIILVVVGCMVATEIVKLAYFRRLIKPKIRPALSAQIQKVRSRISESQKEFLGTLSDE